MGRQVSHVYNTDVDTQGRVRTPLNPLFIIRTNEALCYLSYEAPYLGLTEAEPVGLRSGYEVRAGPDLSYEAPYFGPEGDRHTQACKLSKVRNS